MPVVIALISVIALGIQETALHPQLRTEGSQASS